MKINYSQMTYEKLMEQCLAQVPGNVDKREGSIIWTALGPACAKLAELYSLLSTEMDRAFPDTALDMDLTNKAKERGVFRLQATKAVRRGVFQGEGGAPFDIPLGSRFSGGDANYAATQREGAGAYLLAAEEPGELGNLYSGNLIPIEYITGLTAATLTDIVIPGEDEESDDSLRQRYLDSLDTDAFGGNIADYKQKVEAMAGVGKVKVFPVWNGGGTVKIVFVTSTGEAPDSVLVEQIQTAVDPEVNQGAGLGTAPIGHVVTVQGAAVKQVEISANISLEPGTQWERVLPLAEKTMQAYFKTLISSWAEVEAITVRVSQIEARLLDVEGVVDVAHTSLNGGSGNLSLAAEEIPGLGGIENAS